MTPAIDGAIRSGPGIREEPQTTIIVAPSIFDPTTTLVIQESLGEESWALARIQLTEDGRRELIELLGGTP